MITIIINIREVWLKLCHKTVVRSFVYQAPDFSHSD